jgi:hypothetical protein
MQPATRSKWSNPSTRPRCSARLTIHTWNVRIVESVVSRTMVFELFHYGSCILATVFHEFHLTALLIPIIQAGADIAEHQEVGRRILLKDVRNSNI